MTATVNGRTILTDADLTDTNLTRAFVDDAAVIDLPDGWVIKSSRIVKG